MASSQDAQGARCPECDWSTNSAENSMRAIARTSGELENHLTGVHGWAAERAQRHARGWAVTAVDESTEG